MKKPLKFNDYKLLKAMSFNDMNRWLIVFYSAAYADGKESLKDDTCLYIEPEDCEVALDGQTLYEIILSVKGIGEKRADEIMAKIKEAGVDDSLWDEE